MIGLRPSGNTQGKHYLLNLHTGRLVTWNNMTILPMSTEIILTVHLLTAASKKHKGIVFTNNNLEDVREPKIQNLSVICSQSGPTVEQTTGVYEVQDTK